MPRRLVSIKGLLLAVLAILVPVEAPVVTVNHGSKPLQDVLKRPEAPVRIIGGHNASFKDNPWQVALVAAARESNNYGQFCGGSVIGSRWVLTAAHCVDQGTTPDQIRILTGTASLTAGGKRVAVLPGGIVVHESWDPASHDFDIALIRVDEDLIGKPIELASSSKPQDGEEVRITGWGALSFHNSPGTADLQDLTLPYVNRDKCNLPVSYNGRITARMICIGLDAGGADACGGDSGGPATIPVGSDRQLIGIHSCPKQICNSSGGGSARQQGRHRQSIAILGNSVTQIAKRVLLLDAASLGDGQQSSGG